MWPRNVSLGSHGIRQSGKMGNTAVCSNPQIAEYAYNPRRLPRRDLAPISHGFVDQPSGRCELTSTSRSSRTPACHRSALGGDARQLALVGGMAPCVVASFFFWSAWGGVAARAGENKQIGPAKKTSTDVLSAAESGPAKAFRETVRPLLKKYCIECHGRETHEGEVNFEGLGNFSAAVGERKTWEKPARCSEPARCRRPTIDRGPRAPNRGLLVRWIDQAVFDLDCGESHDPGHVTIRRLNRAEYNNTIRDLVGVALRPADDFPSDDVGNGFDNMGDVLSLSPLLLEKYLAAAESVSSVALFGIDLKRPPVREFDNASCR